MKRLWLSLLCPLFLGAGEITVDASRAYNVSRSGDDVAQLRRLALNVGTEFGVERVAEEYLKQLKIRTLRAINVGITGRFDENGKYVEVKGSPRLERDLELCRRIGANPHVCVGNGFPAELGKKVPLRKRRIRALGIDVKNDVQSVGPTDCKKLENWYLAFFEYVKITRGFKDAVFEIFNEPDLMFTVPSDPNVKPGYDAMLVMYRAASAAARRFEADHPGIKLTLGGPATTVAYTSGHSGGNWAARLVADCARENLKLDFLGVHHYASVAPFRGPVRAGLTNYASLDEMLKPIQAAIAEHRPGLPVWFTEYGPHHACGTWNAKASPHPGLINGNAEGAALALEALDTMLERNIDFAIYLVTCDLSGRGEPGWRWVSLLTSPGWFGPAYPKAPYHAYKMVSELTGNRVAVNRGAGGVRAFAAFDRETGTLRTILWNHAIYVPEFKPLVREGKTETVTLKIAGAKFARNARAVLRSVDAEHGDALAAFAAGNPVNLRAATPEIRNLAAVDSYSFEMKPGSVAMLEIGPDPVDPTPSTRFPEAADRLLKKGDDASLKQVPGVPGVQPEQVYEAMDKQLGNALGTKNFEAARNAAGELLKLASSAKRPVPFAALKTLADAAVKTDSAQALELYRQAFEAPDADWRGRAGTAFALESVLCARKEFDAALKFSDEVLSGNLPEEIRAEFAVRRMNVFATLKAPEKFLAEHERFQKMKSSPNSKVIAAMAMMNHWRGTGEIARGVAAGEAALRIPGVHPGLRGKLQQTLDNLKKAGK